MGSPRGRFAIAFDGYRREDVDAAITDLDRRRGQLSSKRAETTSKLAEADRHVRALETKVSELEAERGAGSSLPAHLDGFFDEYYERLGRDARSYAISQVEAERDELSRTADIVESTRVQAEEIVAKAAAERDALKRSLEDSRRQVDHILEDGKATADRGARERWKKTEDRLREAVVELERLRDQQRSVLDAVAELHEEIDNSWGRLLGG